MATGTNAKSVAGVKLTLRELDVIKLIAKGYGRNQIADQLGTSPKTVDSHRRNILTKLELGGTVAIVHYAIEHSLIAVPGTQSTLAELQRDIMYPADKE